MQIIKKLNRRTCSRAENKRHINSQAYIKHYPNLRIKEYYGIFQSGLFDVHCYFCFFVVLFFFFLLFFVVFCCFFFFFYSQSYFRLSLVALFSHDILFCLQVFRGNKDRNTVVRNALVPPIRARYVRIYALSWYRHISMRVELYGKYLSK